MLIPQFTLRWLLAITAVCGAFFLLVRYAVQGSVWAAAASIAIVSLVVVLAVHVGLFVCVWLLSFQHPPYAGFWRRAGAFLVDVLPVGLALAFSYDAMVGFEMTVMDFFDRAGQVGGRDVFLSKVGTVAAGAWVIYILYAAVAEGSAMQGTIGKRLLGMRVLDVNGRRLGYFRSIFRNGAKMLSVVSGGLGCLWIAWSGKKRGWHDLLAKSTVVMKRENAQLAGFDSPFKAGSVLGVSPFKAVAE